MEFAAIIIAAVAMEFAAIIVPAFIAFVTVRVEVSTPFAVEFSLVAGSVAELCGTAFPACGIFPAALLAGLFRHDGDGTLFAFLLFAFAVIGVAFAFLAREEFLAFGLGAAAQKQSPDLAEL